MIPTRFVRAETLFGLVMTLPIPTAADMLVCGTVAEIIRLAVIPRLLMSWLPWPNPPTQNKQLLNLKSKMFKVLLKLLIFFKIKMSMSIWYITFNYGLKLNIQCFLQFQMIPTRFVKAETLFGHVMTLPIPTAADIMMCGTVAEITHLAAIPRLLMSWLP